MCGWLGCIVTAENWSFAVLEPALYARQLTWVDAQRFVGQQILAIAPTAAGPVDVTLEVSSVVESPAAPGVHQFAICFEGPADSFLAQGTYQLRHAELGDFAVFMTPIARLPAGFAYEACFSHVV
jgi:hypothetical protein